MASSTQTTRESSSRVSETSKRKSSFSSRRSSGASKISERDKSEQFTPSRSTLKKLNDTSREEFARRDDKSMVSIQSSILERWKNKPIFRYGDATQDGEELSKAALINLKPIFNMYKNTSGRVKWLTLEQILAGQGLNQRQDQMVQRMLQHLHNKRPNTFLKDIDLDFEEFKELAMIDLERSVAAFMEMLVIRDFERYMNTVHKFFERARPCNDGNVWDDYGEPWTTEIDSWGFSVVSVHGQRASLGNSTTPFPLTNLSEPLILCVAYDLLGHFKVDSVIDRKDINYDDSLHINERKQPRYPFSKLASIMIASAIRSAPNNMTDSQKHDYILSFLKAISGGEYLRFNNSWYTLEKENDHLMHAASEFLQSIKGTSCSHQAATDLIMQIRAMEVNCESLATIAGTLANGGVSLQNGNIIVSPETVMTVLSLMEKAGHGKQSPSFAFQIGLPCKSGQSGGLMVVIPGVLGIGLYSPRVHGLVSPRAFQFLKTLVEKFDYHPLWHTESVERRLKILRKAPPLQKEPKYFKLFTLAAQGDLTLLQEELEDIGDLEDGNLADNFGFTALHVSAARGNFEIVKFLIDKYPEMMFKKDMMDMKPVNYAEKCGYKVIMTYLKQHEAMVQVNMLQKKISEKKRVTISNEPPQCINFPCVESDSDEEFFKFNT